MFKRFAAILFVLITLTGFSFSQSPIPVVPIPVPVINKSANKVEGLELPPDLEVVSDEGFVSVSAVCKGSVKWLVICQNKIKYIVNDNNNSIVVSVPQNGTISIFAVGLVEAKLKDFAKTIVTVKGLLPNPTPNPSPTPNPTPSPTPSPTPKPSTSLHVTFVLDFNESTPEIASVVNSQSVRKIIIDNKSFIRVYDVTNSIVGEKKLDQVLKQVGGDNMMLVQDSEGKVLYASPIPKSESETLIALKKYIP